MSTTTARTSGRLRALVALTFSGALVLAGCATPDGAAPAGASLAPVGGTVSAVASEGGAANGAVPAAAACENPVASYAPDGPLPGPGALPAGSTMAAIRDRGSLIRSEERRVGKECPV